MATLIKEGSTVTTSEKRQRTIDNLREISNQLKEAADLNLEVIQLLEQDYRERALETAVNAYGFLCIAHEAEQKIINSIE